ncbi:MAG: hypothetical protein DRR19_02510 [Candidatus Parabeggiatoa sp. nov. 1]|nr:MAG: hypothetical protein DRR19_02510 [Gammaproteobacteria bacterium]
MKDKIRLYLERVEQLYTPIKQWFTDENLVVVSSRVETIERQAMYKVTQLTVKTPEGETLAEIKPTSSKVIVGEGLIEIAGWFGKETLVYMTDGGPQIAKPSRNDRKKPMMVPMYKGIEVDGWYWIENSRRRIMHLVSQALFLELITFVSDYEF